MEDSASCKKVCLQITRKLNVLLFANHNGDKLKVEKEAREIRKAIQPCLERKA